LAFLIHENTKRPLSFFIVHFSLRLLCLASSFGAQQSHWKRFTHLRPLAQVRINLSHCLVLRRTVGVNLKKLWVHYWYEVRNDGLIHFG